MKSQQFGQKRGPARKLRLVGDCRDIVIDGMLDDEYRQTCPSAAIGKLRELQTGRAPTFPTTFKAAWQGSNLCFAIRCNESESPHSSMPGHLPSQNRERNLADDDGALEAYNLGGAGRKRLCGAYEYAALPSIARIQPRRGRYDETLQTLDRIGLESLQGT